MTDLIYTWLTIPHRAAGRSPAGLNALFGDMHVTFSASEAAFDTKLWGGTGPSAAGSTSNPGDNKTLYRTIVSYLRP